MTPQARRPFCDTDVLIRLLTGDDPAKQAAAANFFTKVERGELTVAAPDTVIADAVFVLSSPRLYALGRVVVRDLLSPLVRLPHFRVDNRAAVLGALDLFASSRLDFGDAFIIASMREVESEVVYSYDHDFDSVAGLTRVEP